MYADQWLAYGDLCSLITGKERDPETGEANGNDYFGARYYSSSMGRWLSPDKPFADQHTTNPQSWNLYAYARNNPERNVDVGGFKVLQGVVAEALGKIASMPKGQPFYLDFAGIRGLHNHESLTPKAFNDWHADHTVGNSEVIPNKRFLFGLLQAFVGSTNRDQSDTALDIIKKAPAGTKFAMDTYSNGVNGGGETARNVASGFFVSATVVAPNTGNVSTLQAIDDADSGPFEIYQSVNDPALTLALFGSMDIDDLVAAFPQNVTLTDQPSHNLNKYHTSSEIEDDAARQCGLGNPAACNH